MPPSWAQNGAEIDPDGLWDPMDPHGAPLNQVWIVFGLILGWFLMDFGLILDWFFIDFCFFYRLLGAFYANIPLPRKSCCCMLVACCPEVLQFGSWHPTAPHAPPPSRPICFLSSWNSFRTRHGFIFDLCWSHVGHYLGYFWLFLWNLNLRYLWNSFGRYSIAQQPLLL